MLNRRLFFIAFVNALLFGILRNGGDPFAISALYVGKIFLIFLSTAALFYCIFYIANFLPKFYATLIQRIFVGIYFTIGIIELFIFANFQTLLNPAFFDAFLSTSIIEAKDFLNFQVNYRTLLIALLFTLLSILYFYIPIKSYNLFSTNKTAFVLFIVCAIVIFSKGLKYVSEDQLILTRWVNIATMYFCKQKEYITYFKSLQDSTNNPTKDYKITHAIPNIVLIIGESTQRNYMGIYEYPLNTTPQLQVLKDRGNLFVFSDIVSPTAHTNSSIARLLTFSNYENTFQEWFEKMNLIDIMKFSGYSTQWFSNQSAMSLLGNVPEILSGRSSLTAFSSLGGDENASVFNKDEVLIELFKEKHTSKDKNFYIFHLMDSHFTRSLQQKDLTYFKPSDLSQKSLNVLKNGANLSLKQLKIKTEYINTILYNDYVVSEIIRLFENKNAMVIYLSNQANEVYEDRDFVGRADNLASRYMIEIPFVIYVSDQFKETFPEIVKKLETAKDKPQMSDDFIHSFLDITGISAPDTIKERSIFSSSYINRPRIFAGKDYDLELKSAYPFKSPSKIWLHATNEIQKFKDFKTVYQNFEIDVHFIASVPTPYFDVGHDGLKESIGLSLLEMLKDMKNDRSNMDEKFQPKIWLDFKNLTQENANNALETLKNICSSLNIDKESFIIESQNFESLGLFKQAGFYTSYYIPYQKKDLKKIPKKIQQDIQSVIDSGNVNAISFSSYFYAFMKQSKFTRIHNGEEVDIDLLTWDQRSNYRENASTEMFYDPQVKVILAGEKKLFRNYR